MRANNRVVIGLVLGCALILAYQTIGLDALGASGPLEIAMLTIASVAIGYAAGSFERDFMGRRETRVKPAPAPAPAPAAPPSEPHTPPQLRLVPPDPGDESAAS